MRLQIISDIHTEFHDDCGKQFIQEYLRPKDVDILLIAGDLADHRCMTQTIDLLAKAYQNSWILYVPGNHDYYGSSIPKMLKHLKTIFSKYPNFVLLNNDLIRLNGIDFVGTTLWFKYNNVNAAFSNRLNDFRMIQAFDTQVVEENKKARNFLGWHVSPNSIVITHHIPTVNSIPNHFRLDPTNAFYLCDMEKMIKKRKPKLWVHGHTHHSFNYLLGKTHIICNPLGYAGREINPEFISNMMIDL